MKSKLRIPLIILATSLVAVTVTCFFKSDQSSLAFFDFQKVYNESPLKKNLEKDLEKVVSNRKNQLDSLNLELSLLSNKIDAKQASAFEMSNFDVLKDQFLQRQSMYEEENVRLKQSYYDQITEEIREKARLFCEKNGYEILLSNNDGTLVFGSERRDVTAEFQNFLRK